MLTLWIWLVIEVTLGLEVRAGLCITVGLELGKSYVKDYLSSYD